MKDWREKVSQSKYNVIFEKDACITVRDGVRIAADIYRPDAPGRFPALVGMSPYGKDVQTLPVPDFPSDSKLGNGGIEAGNSEFFVSRGYVHVIADVRGTGRSEGAYGNLNRHEYEDGHDIVEWIGTQSWCNGNVGMLGMSYFSMIQIGVAALNPPHLKALFLFDSLSDMYRQWGYHGGILNIGFFPHWWPIVLAHTCEDPDIPKAELEQRVSALNKDIDIRSYPTAYIALNYPQKNRQLHDLLAHPMDGPYYWERSAYTKFSRVNVPCFVFSRWTGFGLHLPGAFQTFNAIKTPKKMEIIIPESGPGFNRPWVRERHDLVLRWYDHWLKGNDTGIMDEPPIRIFVQGIDQYRDEYEWPLARTNWTKFYLREQGALSKEPPVVSEQPDTFTNKIGLKQPDKMPSLIYTTPPLAEDTEITGPSAAYLRASLSRKDANWFVELRDLNPDGSHKTLTMGWLKASHREMDAVRSLPYQPFHSHTRLLPPEPGEINEYAVPIVETSNVFRKGHSIQIRIKGQDAPGEGKEYFHAFLYHLPRSEATEHTVYHTGSHQSYVLLPVIGN